MMNFQPSVTKVCRSLSYLILLFPLIMISLISLESQAKSSSESRTKVSRQKRVSQSSHKIRKLTRSSRQSRRRATSLQRRSRKQQELARRGYRGSSYRRTSRRTRRHTTVRHRPYYGRRTRTDSNSGVMNELVLEVGGHLFSPLQGDVNSGMHLAIGSRLGPVAGVLEAQFAQGEFGAELHDLNAQLRVYLPISPNVELFPLVAIGQSRVTAEEGASHLDLGIGAQLNLTDNFALGGRYSARMIAEDAQGVPTNGHNLLAQVSITF